MSEIHTNIPAAALPTDLSESNVITSEYESFSLIPRMGPMTYAYHFKRSFSFILDLARTSELLDSVVEYNEKWGKIPAVPNLLLDQYSESDSRKPVKKIDAKMVIEPQLKSTTVSSRKRLDRLRRFKPDRVPVNEIVSNTDVREMEADEAQLDTHMNILSRAAEPNTVVHQLAESEVMFNNDGIFSKKFLDLPKSDRMKLVVEHLGLASGKVRKTQEKMAEHMLDRGLKYLSGKAAELRKIAEEQPDFRQRLVGAVAGKIDTDRVLGTIDTIEDPVIAESREWAFLRQERVELALGKPQFRGPVAANSVAPNSTLSISRSHSTGRESQDYSLNRAQDSLSSNQLIASQIKQRMGTLFDYGSNLGQTMSEEGFSKDSSRNEKRNLIESTLSRISEVNASQKIVGGSNSSSHAREYVTEGKDSTFSTSEVAFEVFSPVKVTHFLDGIGAVWCPRIVNPFSRLKQVIKDYRSKVESDYIRENAVVDPAEPAPTYEGFERVHKSTTKIRSSEISDGNFWERDNNYSEVVRIELSDEELSDGFLISNDVKVSFKQDSSGIWSTTLDSDQYEVLDYDVEEHERGSHIEIKVGFKIFDENTLTGNPNSIWLDVSVSKYKLTQSYLEKKREYDRINDQVNPARREAVEVQARKYARLKSEELIRKYESSVEDLKDYAFVALMKKIFQGSGSESHWSFYQGIIKRCVDWSRASIEPEPASPGSLSASGLSPYHFLNVEAIRFFLPVHPDSEETFFEVFENSVDQEWAELFESVRDYIDGQRSSVEEMRERMSEADRESLTLDSYDSELVLGQHLESVLSKHAFKVS
ncbi:hypothetical protein [Microbulbifer halophilus]|uniref:Uncharacterized protein n=1 Tax=Microbulbifer halophilus TaxID=453963 RepID=A0ABW5EHF8_9GAMM|nr:hypothetical protein [Microbulbifer halophilus]MCW8126370.1 hypothetical protein [Microbulbifer halophilus]